MPKLDRNVIPNQRNFQDPITTTFRRRPPEERQRGNLRGGYVNHVIPNERNFQDPITTTFRRRPPEGRQRESLREGYANHVIPNERNSPNRVSQIYHPRPYVDSQPIMRTGSQNFNLSLREMGYLPFIGTMIGICHVAYGLFLILHFDSHHTLEGFSWCGRGLVEMIPFVGGFSLYIYDNL